MSNLDQQLMKAAARIKNLVLLDLSFPDSAFSKFKSHHEKCLVHIPCFQSSALALAAGLASQGKLVLVYGLDCEDFDLPDSSLSVKLLKRSREAVWDYFMDEVLEFGPAVLLIPHDD